MTESEIGYDETAQLASEEWCTRYRALAQDPSVPAPIREYIAHAAADEYPLYQVLVIRGEESDDEALPPASPASLAHSDPPSHDNESSSSQSDGTGGQTIPVQQRWFIIGRPHFAADAIAGRCTRGYVALDTETQRVCFVKDCWRLFVEGCTRPEHLIYERLRACGATKGIATLICGGDVGGSRAQQTTVDGWLGSLSSLRPVPRIHYRMATEEVGIRLKEFKNFRELGMVFIDAITGMILVHLYRH